MKITKGQKFGRLTATHPSKLFWCCHCECGRTAHVLVQALLLGHTKSCGCLSGLTVGVRNRTHNKSKTPAYSSWASMKQRCLNVNNPSYPNWGGRGITICDRWLKFEAFLADMGPRPAGTSLDRIDNDGPYAPENCRWATHQVQTTNSRQIRPLTLNGRTQLMGEWARELGMRSTATLSQRLIRGMSEAEALSRPVGIPTPHRLPLTLNGRTQSRKAWSQELGIPLSTIARRVQHGLSDAEALSLSRSPRVKRHDPRSGRVR